MPSSPRSQKLCTCVRRSAKVVGVVSENDEKTLISPLFSATKTRPSAEKRTTVGFVRPLNAVVSTKPLGSALAVAGPARQAAARTATTTVAATPDLRGRGITLPTPLRWQRRDRKARA